MAYQHVKIFGERNSSTKALKSLVETNSNSRVLPSIATEIDRYMQDSTRAKLRNAARPTDRENALDELFSATPERFSWKHTATIFESPDTFDDCLILFCLRNPASWLLALHRRPYHALQPIPQSFNGFMVMDWKPVRRDNVGDAPLTPIELYNRKIASYLLLAEQLKDTTAHCVFVNFEHFAVDQISVYQRLSNSLDSASEIPAIVERSTSDPSKTAEYYRSYYGEERWQQELDAASIEMINQHIDWHLLKPFGYQPIIIEKR